MTHCVFSGQQYFVQCWHDIRRPISLSDKHLFFFFLALKCCKPNYKITNYHFMWLCDCGYVWFYLFLCICIHIHFIHDTIHLYPLPYIQCYIVGRLTFQDNGFIFYKLNFALISNLGSYTQHFVYECPANFNLHISLFKVS